MVFCGDVVGKPGREALKAGVPTLKTRFDPLFLVVNGENAAAGVGITPAIADEFYSWGVDAITLGNHAFNKREIGPYLDGEKPIVRPSNMPPNTPGRGVITVTKEGIQLALTNLCGRVFLDGYDDPFREFDRLVRLLETPHVLVDFHAEATSEKVAFGYHAEGRATCVLGTHTHVQTADERVLEGGTAVITDVGMTGPSGSVIGMDREIILKRFLTTLPQKFEVGTGRGVICGVCVGVNRLSGRAISIERFQLMPEEMN
ncbi:MAG: TIGR00282 family metallophosphoesterase [Armatimonadetes bacterium]|nr:TIGR00282 family metallophosphoesterase [Armatimonadota bacterium]